MKCNNYKNLEFKNYGRRKTIKGMMFGTIFGFLIAGGIGVAAVTLQAEQVKYTPSNDKFNATNVKEAMDEIYKLAEYEVPADTHFYDSNTKGEEIVRYKKVNGKYYLCDENGIVQYGSSAVDINDKILVPYIASGAGNIGAGAACFASNSLILGDGSNSGMQRVYKGHISNTTGDRDGSTVDLSTIIPEWYDKINLIMIQLTSSYTYDSNTGLLTISPGDIGGIRTFETDFIVAVN